MMTTWTRLAALQVMGYGQIWKYFKDRIDKITDGLAVRHGKERGLRDDV